MAACDVEAPSDPCFCVFYIPGVSAMIVTFLAVGKVKIWHNQSVIPCSRSDHKPSVSQKKIKVNHKPFLLLFL